MMEYWIEIVDVTEEVKLLVVNFLDGNPALVADLDPEEVEKYSRMMSRQQGERDNFAHKLYEQLKQDLTSQSK